MEHVQGKGSICTCVSVSRCVQGEGTRIVCTNVRKQHPWPTIHNCDFCCWPAQWRHITTTTASASVTSFSLSSFLLFKARLALVPCRVVFLCLGWAFYSSEKENEKKNIDISTQPYIAATCLLDAATTTPTTRPLLTLFPYFYIKKTR